MISSLYLNLTLRREGDVWTADGHAAPTVGELAAKVAEALLARKEAEENRAAAWSAERAAMPHVVVHRNDRTTKTRPVRRITKTLIVLAGDAPDTDGTSFRQDRSGPYYAPGYYARDYISKDDAEAVRAAFPPVSK